MKGLGRRGVAFMSVYNRPLDGHDIFKTTLQKALTAKKPSVTILSNETVFQKERACVGAGRYSKIKYLKRQRDAIFKTGHLRAATRDFK